MRLAEVYTSIQGEGPNTGVPTQFVRFGGCNMRCPGWPCDTQFAIDPVYRDNWQLLEAKEVIDRVAEWPKHVCITGGEPLIQRKAEMELFGKTLLQDGYTIDLFTNGSQPLPTWVRAHDDGRVTVIMDWKLPGSGEEFSGIVQRRENRTLLRANDAVKFVVASLEDMVEARRLFGEWCIDSSAALIHKTYIGAVWGKIKDEQIVNFVLDNGLPWYLNVQTHKYIWEPNQRKV